jgi:uncharacterized damage-inducible protein DinB
VRSADLLLTAFDNIASAVHAALAGLSPAELAARIGPDANPVGWLVWHLTRVQDDHVADVAGTEQVWTAGNFAAWLDLPFDASEIGYGQPSDAVGRVETWPGDLLASYHDEVHAATARFVAGLTDADLDRVVDTRWDPPVTLGVRLVSVVTDDLQHVGQAAFARGILRRGTHS